MTREDAIRLFGGEPQRLARALDLNRSRIYQWPSGAQLPQRDVDRVIGAALRCGVLRFKDGPVIRMTDVLS